MLKIAGALVFVLLLAISAGIIVKSPPGSFNPFCTYSSQYELTASLRVNREVLTSTARIQKSQVRPWVATIAYGGCQQSYGRALAFKAEDGRAFLVPTQLCELAEDVLADVKQVDVLRICEGRWPNSAVGFVVAPADGPTTWAPFDFTHAGNVELTSMKAASYEWGSPDDVIDELLPALANTFFEDAENWWQNPRRILRSPRAIVYHAEKEEGSISMRRSK